MAINGLGAISAANIQTMDLETAMMAVQSNRANLLETQLKDQIASVQAKNDQVANLNAVLGQLNGVAAKFSSGAQAGDTLNKLRGDVKKEPFPPIATQDEQDDFVAALKGSSPQAAEASGESGDALKSNPALAASGPTTDILAKIYTASGLIPPNAGTSATLSSFFNIKDTGKLTLNDIPKSAIDGAIAKVKGNIDSLSNTQQMDMLRLQSLSNKRNEAFDLMTNFIKKMQDSRSSILGNMR